MTEENIIHVDRTQVQLTDGNPVTADHRELKPNGQQKGYVVLTEQERTKGFQRPVRRTYIHAGINPVIDGAVLIKPGEGGCGIRTTMALAIAETYARDPKFYTGTFCCECNKHFPVEQFVWEGTNYAVGS